MEFKDRYDAHHFSVFYGFLVGFVPVITHVARTTAKRRNGEELKITMKCHCYDDAATLFSGHKYMNEMEKALIRTLSHNNIPTRKMISILSYLRGGVTALPYKKKDVSNYRTKINREVTGTDMNQVMSYFRQRKDNDPTFFYKFELVEEKRLKNIFWCDESSVKFYAEYGDYVSFDTRLMEEFEDVVNNSITIAEFETLWQKMITDYGLESNKYFARMWETRERFIHVYYKNDFFPFIHSTTRSETTNARFKDNVGPTYSMISFMREYQRIVDTINMVEAAEDTCSRQKQHKELLFGYNIEEQAQSMYNRNIFKKFQVQLQATSTMTYHETQEGKQFEVWPRKGQEEFSCICGKFNKDGYCALTT
ncbi:hypothetical protein BS78_08G079400 [Paspalum vaginatum]|nr:hypothetical protein BS78_08G079400 [Paspalum vaginatum]